MLFGIFGTGFEKFSGCGGSLVPARLPRRCICIMSYHVGRNQWKKTKVVNRFEAHPDVRMGKIKKQPNFIENNGMKSARR